MKTDAKQLHVAITGASSGIGRALALEYARAGAKLTLVARRTPLLKELAAEIAGPCQVVSHDLSDTARAAAWVPLAEAVQGPIDVLINNAGRMVVARTAELTADAGQEMINLCLTSPLRLTRAVLPGMIARGSGTVVQVASMAAFTPLIGTPWYAAAKAGLGVFSETLRAELAGTGVNILTVYPGPVHTALEEGARDAYAPSRTAELVPQGTPEVLARLVRTAVEKRKTRVVYPRSYQLARWFPNVLRALTYKVTPEVRAPAAAPALERVAS